MRSQLLVTFGIVVGWSVSTAGFVLAYTQERRRARRASRDPRDIADKWARRIRDAER